MTLPSAVRGVPLGMRKIPEYFDSADRPVVAADIFASEDSNDEEEDEDEGEKDEGYLE